MALALRSLPPTLLALLVLLSATASPLAAQSEVPLSLRWFAPTECPSAEEVEARMRATLQGSQRATSARNLMVRARVTRKGALRFVLRVRFGGDLSGERELQAESCQAAADAMVLLVALAVDPEHTAQAGSSSSSTAVTTPPTAGAAPSTHGATASTSAEPQREQVTQDENVEPETASAPSPDTAQLALEFSLGGGAALDTGTTPGVTAGLHAVAEIAVHRLHVAVSGVWLLPRDKDLNAGASLSTGWLGAAVDACALWGTQTALGPCLGAEAGVLTLATNGLRDARDDAPFAFFARTALAARARLTANLSGALWVGVHTPLSYPRLLVAGETEAFRPSVFGVRATLTLLWVLR